MAYTEQQFDEAMRLLLEAKLQINYWGATGQWFWSSRSDAESLDDWQGPFPTYFQALADAVAPYTLLTYFAVYRDVEAGPLDFDVFPCQAIDYEHAIEQCQDAYPDADVLWANCRITAEDVLAEWLQCSLESE